MHELSIATSIADLARRHVPAGSVLKSVLVRAGPMRGIDRQAMEWAWEAAVADTDLAGSRLELELLPWRLRCPVCAREFVAADAFTACSCGYAAPYPLGGDELVIVSLEVDEEERVVG